MSENIAKVMWLEENVFIIDKYKKLASQFDLELNPFFCWEDAKTALLSDVKGWGAIILDPQCKLGKGDRPKPQKFLPQVLCDITAISTKFNIILPWYIYTDIAPSIFEDLVIADRNVFDAEWEQPYYVVGEDDDNLFFRIKQQTSSLERTKIRNGVHRELFDVLSALTAYGFVLEDVATVEDILISLYEHKESKRCNFVCLRKIIESLFKSMMHFNILPNNLCNVMGELNLVGIARLLAGMDCRVGDFQYTMKEKVLDRVAAYNLYNILNICHGDAHSKSINVNTKKCDTNEYLNITKTNNLLYACCLMLADIIIMYYRFLKNLLIMEEIPVFWTKTKV